MNETTEQAERAERIAWTLRNIESAEAKARHGHPATVTVALADLRAILAALDPRDESMHGPDGWCGETRAHTHGLSEGIITYTDGRPAILDQ